MKLRTSFFLLALSLPASQSAFCDDWPMWRGPRGDGMSLEPEAPLEWSATKNIQWKTAIPGDGRSSPIVIKDSIFVTSALPESQSRRLIRVDRESGKLIWDVEVHCGPIEQQHKFNTSASSTPASDGSRIYTIFVDDEKMVVSAVNWDGKIEWQIIPGTFMSKHGLAASPVICDAGLLVNGHQDGTAFVVLLDPTTGKEVWRYKPDTDLRSFSTPVVAPINGSRQIVISGATQTLGLDIETGKRIWWVDGPTEKVVCTPSIGLGHIFSFGGSPEVRAFAVKQGGVGDLTKTNIAWTYERGMPYVPTPLLSKEYMHVINDGGIYTCMEPISGRILKTIRKGGNVYSSPVGIAGRVYLFDDDGLCTVIADGPNFEILAKNALDELSKQVLRSRMVLFTFEVKSTFGKLQSKISFSMVKRHDFYRSLLP